MTPINAYSESDDSQSEAIRRYGKLGCTVPLGISLLSVMLVTALGFYGYQDPDNPNGIAAFFAIFGGIVVFPIAGGVAIIAMQHFDFRRALLTSNRMSTDTLAGESAAYKCPHCAHLDTPAEPDVCINCGKHSADNIWFANGDGLEFEKALIGIGIGGGAVLIVVSVVWFVVGLLAGVVWFYPGLLLLLGVIAVIKGLRTRSARPTVEPDQES